VKNRNKALIVGGCALLVLLFLLVWAANRKTRYQWKETFRSAEGQPYDLSIFHELLGQYSEGGLEDVRQRPRAVLGSGLGREGANYIFVGEFPHYDIEDVDSILAFVAAGGHALISAKSFWLNASFPTTCLSTASNFQAAVYDQRVALWLADSVVAVGGADSLCFAPKGIPENYAWSAFDSSFAEVVATCGIRTIGWLGSQGTRYPNGLQVPYGAGQLILHATPLAFTNIQMLRPGAHGYASGICSYLRPGKIRWDAASHKPLPLPSDEAENQPPNARGFEQSPLRYLLTQDELRWAWYLLLAVAALFVLFRSKRRQRIVPIVRPLRNTSLAFVESVGRLYFQQNDDRRLVHRIMKQFLYHLRTRYYLEIKEDEIGAAPRIALKSGVPEERIREIFSLFERYRMADVGHDQLRDFHRAVDYFYRNAV
jgi:hypothetical protein